MNTTLETVTSADGTRIAVGRTGDGPPVILVGGAFNDRSTVTGLAASLAPRFTASPTTGAVPGARHLTLEGQDHGVLREPEALRPVLGDFLA